jgi:hypothetical protein
MVQFGSLPHLCCGRNLWEVKAISNKELLLFAKAKFTDHEQFVIIWDFIELAWSNGLTPKFCSFFHWPITRIKVELGQP